MTIEPDRRDQRPIDLERRRRRIVAQLARLRADGAGSASSPLRPSAVDALRTKRIQELRSRLLLLDGSVHELRPSTAPTGAGAEATAGRCDGQDCA